MIWVFQKPVPCCVTDPRVVALLTFSSWSCYDARNGAVLVSKVDRVVGLNSSVMAFWSPPPRLVCFGPCQHHFPPLLFNRHPPTILLLPFACLLIEAAPWYVALLKRSDLCCGVQPRRLRMAKGWTCGLCNP